MKRRTKPPSQTWRAFLRNHLSTTASIDFFTVPTATFRVLFCFVVLCHGRRSVAHFNVTEHPTSQWTAQQVIEAFPYDKAPRYLIRDRDSIYGEYFRHRVKNMQIEEVLIAPRSPWRSLYVERLIGSIRRECLNHVIILNAKHLRQIITAYSEYYHASRPHLFLDRNSPTPRDVEPPELGEIIAIAQVGGVYHRYKRAA